MSTLSDMAIGAIDREWATGGRWADVERTYEAADVVRLRGSVRVEHSLARRGDNCAVGHLGQRRDVGIAAVFADPIVASIHRIDPPAVVLEIVQHALAE